MNWTATHLTAIACTLIPCATLVGIVAMVRKKDVKVSKTVDVTVNDEPGE